MTSEKLLFSDRAVAATPRKSVIHYVKCYAVVIVMLLSLLGFMFSRRELVTVALSNHDIFDRAPLIDGHNDFPIWIRAFYQNHIYQENFTHGGDLSGQVDFPRLQRGRVRGQFWSVYVECPQTAGNYSDEIYREIIHDTLQQIDLVKRIVKDYPEYLESAFSADNIMETFAASSRIASLMGIEGLHQIGNSASIMRIYYSLGVRYASLSHTCHNAYADSEEPREALHRGLSKAGRAIVKEMNRLGMLIDLSHTSFDTQRDALSLSAAPVIFSHSNAFTRCRHTRNVPDDVLQQLKANDGVIMVTFYASFLEDDPSQASLSSVADHIQYIGDLIGYRHVGIGSDFDGMSQGPKDLEDVSMYPRLVEELQARGIPEAAILGVLGLNIVRVLREAEKVAWSMRGLQPLEDDVKPFFGM